MCIGLWLLLVLPSLYAAPKKTTSSKATPPSFDIKVSGVASPILDNVQKSVLSLSRRLPADPSIEDLNTFFEQIPDTAEKALAPYGYFSPTIHVRKTRQAKEKWLVTLTVNTGPQTRIYSLHVAIIGAGKDNAALQKIIQNFPLKVGDPLNTELYEQTKKKLTASANTAGYMSPTFTTHEIKVNKATRLADINLVFDTGPQYYFGGVHFDQHFYEDSFLQRFPTFKEGEVYSPQAVADLQQNLSGTPYFSTINVEPQQNADTTTIPILVGLTPSKSQYYSFGAGYGTDTGPRLTTSWEQRHVTDTGQYFKSFLQLSKVQSTLDARYIIPGKDPVNQQYFIGASFQQQSPDNNSKGTTEKLSVGKQQLWGSWTTSSSLSLQHDRYSLLGDPYRDSSMLLPSVTLYKTSYDDIVFPRNGYSANITVRGASKATYSDTNFFQTEFVPKMILSPFDFSRIVLRADLGYTAISDPEDLPLSLQFFAGGSDSIRGYDYEELGPGRYLFVGSAEYQQHVYKEWWGTTFIDAGNAVNSLTNPQDHVVGKDQPHIDLSELLKRSVGIGVMYASPVGPIELTLAKPITDDHKSLSIQFTMGAT